MKQKLRECPFCGGEAEYISELGNVHEVHCKKCECIGPFGCSDIVKLYWNNGHPFCERLLTRDEYLGIIPKYKCDPRLKSCPFCGSRDLYLWHFNEKHETLHCGNCKAWLHAKTKENLIALWNSGKARKN